MQNETSFVKSTHHRKLHLKRNLNIQHFLKIQCLWFHASIDFRKHVISATATALWIMVAGLPSCKLWRTIYLLGIQYTWYSWLSTPSVEVHGLPGDTYFNTFAAFCNSVNNEPNLEVLFYTYIKNVVHSNKRPETYKTYDTLGCLLNGCQCTDYIQQIYECQWVMHIWTAGKEQQIWELLNISKQTPWKYVSK